MADLAAGAEDVQNDSRAVPKLANCKASHVLPATAHPNFGRLDEEKRLAAKAERIRLKFLPVCLCATTP